MFLIVQIDEKSQGTIISFAEGILCACDTKAR